MVNNLCVDVVWANTYNKLDPPSPFGDLKESGFGRERGLHELAGSRVNGQSGSLISD